MQDSRPGVIDLRHQPLSEKALNLAGTWRFFPGQLLGPNDISQLRNRPSTLIKVPGLWTQASSIAQKPSLVKTRSYGTYLLIIEGLQAYRGRALAIHNMQAIAAAKVYWIDSKSPEQAFNFDIGVVAEHEDQEVAYLFNPVIELPKLSGHRAYLLIQVSSLQADLGGIQSAPKLGFAEVAKRKRQLAFYEVYFLLGIYIMAAIFNLMLYMNRRRDGASFWLAVTCLLVASRMVGTENLLELIFGPSESVFRISVNLRNHVIILAACSYLYFIYYSFPGTIKKQWVDFFTIVNSFYAMISGVIPLYLVGMLWTPVYLFNLILVVMVGFALVVSFRKRARGSKYITAGACFALLSAVHDYLVFARIYDLPYLFHYGVAVFIFFNTLVTGQRFSAALIQSERLVKTLRENERSRSQFFQNISHELRTPLNGILGFVDLAIAGQYGQMEQELRSKLVKVRRLAAGLKEQVNQILDLARSRPTEMILNLAHIELNRLVETIEQLADGLKARLPDTSYDLVWNWKADPPDFISDWSKVSIIVNNLVSNAFKFKDPARPNHVVIQLHYVTHQYLEIVVSDTGLGIPKKDLGRIFQAFEQVHSNKHSYFEGTGIGLALLRRLLKFMEGAIYVKSQIGVGSRFRVRIPHQEEVKQSKLRSPRRRRPTLQTLDEVVQTSESIATAQANNANVQSQRSPANRIAVHVELERGLVLVCDDNEVNREVICDVISSQGYKVLLATNGKQCLEILQSITPDLVILDLMMPGISGEQVLREIRGSDRWSHLHVMLLTARASHEDALLGLSIGADDYLAKPFDKNELIIRVNNIVDRHKLQQKRLEHETNLATASLIQKSFIPPVIESSLIRLDYFYRASEHIGGDWFQYYFSEAENRLFIVMGDVTGHGFGSALVTATVAGSYHSFVNLYLRHHAGAPPEEILEKLANSLNEAILDLTPERQKMMTMALLCVDYELGQVSYINAGHEGIYLVQNGKVCPHLVPGSPLGFRKELKHRFKSFSYHPGDSLFLYTDGLVEQSPFASRRLAQKQLQAILAQNFDPKQCKQELLSAFCLEEDQVPLEDDCTFLIVKQVA